MTKQQRKRTRGNDGLPSRRANERCNIDCKACTNLFVAQGRTSAHTVGSCDCHHCFLIQSEGMSATFSAAVPSNNARTSFASWKDPWFSHHEAANSLPGLQMLGWQLYRSSFSNPATLNDLYQVLVSTFFLIVSFFFVTFLTGIQKTLETSWKPLENIWKPVYNLWKSINNTQKPLKTCF